MKTINSYGQKPIYRTIEINANEIELYPDGIRDIYERRINGIVIRNVLSPKKTAEISARIERGEPEFEIKWYGDHTAIYGANALWSSEGLHEYHKKTVSFRHNCRKLFSGITDFEQLIKEIFSAMSSGKEIAIPTTLSGESYTPMTIRVITEGGAMGLHFGNGLLQHPACQKLLEKIKFEGHLSYFILLKAPDAGGKLTLYDLEWSDTENGMLKGGKSLESVYTDSLSMPINLGAGDMVLFDGSRILHDVTLVKGGNRISIGGFIGLSRDDRKFYYWS